MCRHNQPDLHYFFDNKSNKSVSFDQNEMKIIEELIQDDIKHKGKTTNVGAKEQEETREIEMGSKHCQGPVEQEDAKSTERSLYRLLEKFLSRRQDSFGILKNETFRSESTSSSVCPTGTYGIRKNSLNAELVSGKLDGLARNLSDHERKLEILRDAGKQVIAKTKDLDQITSNLILYGSNQLEPWRQNISTLTEGILNGVRALEARLDSTIDGCVTMEARVARLRRNFWTSREKMIV